MSSGGDCRGPRPYIRRAQYGCRRWRESDPQREEAVAESRRFTRGENKANIRKANSKSADELRQFAVAELRQRLKFPGMRTKARKETVICAFQQCRNR